MTAKKTWNEKLHDSKGLPKIGPNAGKLFKQWGEGTHVVPAPIEVDGPQRCKKIGLI